MSLCAAGYELRIVASFLEIDGAGRVKGETSRQAADLPLGKPRLLYNDMGICETLANIPMGSPKCLGFLHNTKLSVRSTDNIPQQSPVLHIYNGQIPKPQHAKVPSTRQARQKQRAARLWINCSCPHQPHRRQAPIVWGCTP